jgi:hypothetical protein
MKYATTCAVVMSCFLLATVVLAGGTLLVLGPTFPNQSRAVISQFGAAVAPHLGLTVAAAFASRGRSSTFGQRERTRCCFAVAVVAAYSALLMLLVVLFALDWFKVGALLDALRLCASGLGLPVSAVVTYQVVAASRA